MWSRWGMVAFILALSFAGGALLTRAFQPWMVDQTWAGHDAEVTAVAWSPDDSLATSAARDGRVIIRDTHTGEQMHRLESSGGAAPLAIVFSPDTKAVAIGFADAPALVWRFSEGSDSAHIYRVGPNSAGADLLAVSHKGDRLATVDAPGMLRVWNIDTGELVSANSDRPDGADDAIAMLFSPSDRAIVFFTTGLFGTRAIATETCGALYIGGPIGVTSSGGEFRYGGSNMHYLGQKGLVVVSDSKGWSEEVTLPLLAPVLDTTRPTEPDSEGWVSTTGDVRPDRRGFAAPRSDGSRMLMGQGDGAVLLLRPRRAGDWLATGHAPVFFFLLGATLVYLAGVIRTARRQKQKMAPVMNQGDAPVSRLPLSLRILAGLCIFEGICAVLHIAVSAMRRELMLDFTVLSIWAGIGLRQLNRGWRIYVLVCIWGALVGVGLFAGILWESDEPAITGFKLLGVPIEHYIPDWVGWAFLGTIALPLGCWSLWVLTTPRIASLFTGANTSAPGVELAPSTTKSEPD